MPLRGSQKSEVRSQKSEVLIGKALKILSLMGYFHCAALAKLRPYSKLEF